MLYVLWASKLQVDSSLDLATIRKSVQIVGS